MALNKIGKVIGKAGSKISGFQPKLIEWKDATPNDIVWRYPDEVIPWGSTIVVKEWERAVFYRDGKVYGVLGPGRHVLDTQNVPFLQGLVEGFYGESIFRAIIIFVNINRLQGKFGGRSQTVELIPVNFYGVYYYRVADPALFVNKVVGPDSRFTREELDEYIRSYFLNNLMAFISQSSIKDLYMKAAEASKRAAMVLRKPFDEIGLMLEDVQFEGIDVPPEYRERMFWLMQGTSAAYLVQQETARKFAEAIEKTQAGGAAFGAGVVAIPWALQPPPPQAQQQPATQAPAAATAGVATTAPQQGYVARCPYCGQAPVPQGARFCPFCGKQVKWCPNGHIAPAEANFCPVCGSKLV
ncbi:MAG: SPFH domain-containing protein [Ignisphaera sp.]